MTRSPRGNVGRRCECCRCVECPRLAGLRLFSRTLSRINRWLNRAMIDQTDFIVLYRELGVGPDCSVDRSEEHTSELQSLMRISYAVFCLKKKTKNTLSTNNHSLPVKST